MKIKEPQLPSFRVKGNPKRVLLVQTDPRLPTPRERGLDRVKSVMVFLMAVGIIWLSISAMLGVDPTNPGGNSPVTTEVRKD